VAVLSEFEINQQGVIKEILENQISSKLAEFGMLPGVTFSIQSKAPFNGPIAVLIENSRIAIRRQEAEFILVE